MTSTYPTADGCDVTRTISGLLPAVSNTAYSAISMTKRKADELLGIFDLWYRQEAEAYANEIFALRRDVKLLRKRVRTLDMARDVQQARIRDLEQQLNDEIEVSATRMAIIDEIFDNFPAVRDSYALDADEVITVIDSDEELEDIQFPRGPFHL